MFTKSNNTYSNSLQIELDRLGDGEYEIKPYYPIRNLSQSALYHAFLGYIGKQSGNDPILLHARMKQEFLSKIDSITLSGDTMETLVEGSTKKLSKKAFSEFFTQVEIFFKGYGYDFPHRDSPEFLSLVQEYL